MDGKNEPRGHVTGNLEWDGLHRPRIYYAMAAILSGLFLTVIDGTICNVALPTIARQLEVSSSDSIWIVNAFQLVIIMALLPSSTAGELFGFRRIYRISPKTRLYSFSRFQYYAHNLDSLISPKTRLYSFSRFQYYAHNLDSLNKKNGMSATPLN